MPNNNSEKKEKIEDILQQELDSIKKSRFVRNVPMQRKDSDRPFTQAHDSKLVGLAFSGGGIRSATFNLGILQGLANHDLLHIFDYLSTVSGGGYIGSWLSAWIYRECKKHKNARSGLQTVTNALKTDRPKADNRGNEADEIRFLRKYSNYITPRTGFSADTGTMIAGYAKNSIINLLIVAAFFTSVLTIPYLSVFGLDLLSSRFSNIILPAMIAIFILVIIYIILTIRKNNMKWVNFVPVFVVPLIIIISILAAVKAFQFMTWGNDGKLLWYAATWGMIANVIILYFFSTIISTVFSQILSVQTQQWINRLAAIILQWTIMVFALFSIVVYGPYFIANTGMKIDYSLISGWLLTTVGGILAGKKAVPGRKSFRIITKVLSSIAPYIFMLGLILFLSYVLQTILIKYFVMKVSTGYWDQMAEILKNPLDILAVTGLFGAVSFILSILVNVNDFSLHSLYGSRLVRAYLGASNPDTEKSRRDLFTGFNQSDNAVKLDNLKDGYPGPYPIINTTLNLIKSRDLAWQKRKAASFIFSPRYCGFDRIPAMEDSGSSEEESYRLSCEYAGNVSLGKALTISGAALSPNMGYYTTTAFAFLMTIFNVRLGWWLGNPLKKNKYKKRGPFIGLFYLLKELFAKADLDSKYIYLSDGGHFENLGIYELVKRRCRYIVVCDAAEDRNMQFEGLGNAIEKCRTDFGIDIEVDISQIRHLNDQGYSKRPCAVGKIHYSSIDENLQDGILLYIKASLTGNLPLDIMRYAFQHPDFPHQSTADQWFDETQFESYRRLGEHIATTVFKDAAYNKANIEKLFIELQKRWYTPSIAVERNFTKHASALERIISTMRADSNLKFLDPQLYPVLDKLANDHSIDPRDPRTDKKRNIFDTLMHPISHLQADKKTVQWWFPDNYDEIRSGFFICKEMIQLMEGVYHDLNLDQEFNHPDNRGWINLFRLWWGSRMFRFTWAVTLSTFGARFQTFCEQKMNFKKRRIVIGREDGKKVLTFDENTIRKYYTDFVMGDIHKESPKKINYREQFWREREKENGFNYYERKLLDCFVDENRCECKVYPLKIEIDDDPLKDNTY